MQRLASERIDVVLLDLGCPDSGGLEALRRISEQWPSIPVTALTDRMEEETGLAAIQLGAQDALVKGMLDSGSLKRSIRYAVERKRSEEALRESAQRYRLLADNAADVIWTTDMDFRFTYLSPSIERLRGYTVEEVMVMTLDQVLTPKSLELAMEIFAEEMVVEEQETKDLFRPRTFEAEQYHRDGSTLWTEITSSFLRDTAGRWGSWASHGTYPSASGQSRRFSP